VTRKVPDVSLAPSTFTLIGAYMFICGLEAGFIIPTLWLLLEKHFGITRWTPRSGGSSLRLSILVFGHHGHMERGGIGFLKESLKYD
jgi:hypothetical protein